jgi:immunoglobulin-binding protein 1
MQEPFIDSIEELSTVFRKLSKALANEDAAEDAVKQAGLFEHLRAVERYIQNQGLFSPNEDFDELDFEMLKYLRLPYMIALAHSKIHGPNRAAALKDAEHYYIIFLELLDHYRITPQLINSVLKELKEKGTAFKIEREQKIQLYKEEKAVDSELALAKNKEAERDVARLGLILTAYQTMTALLFIPQEQEILKFKRTLETDPEARRNYEAHRAQPPEKMQWFKIDSTQPNAPVISSQQIQGLPVEQKENSVVVDYSQTKTNKLLNQRQEILEKLNQPCYAQPKMTLDEFDELEYTLMKNKEKKNAEAAQMRKEELARLGIENSDDSDNEIVGDAKRYKAREWDDWKDENEKGSGNRNGR